MVVTARALPKILTALALARGFPFHAGPRLVAAAEDVEDLVVDPLALIDN